MTRFFNTLLLSWENLPPLASGYLGLNNTTVRVYNTTLCPKSNPRWTLTKDIGKSLRRGMAKIHSLILIKSPLDVSDIVLQMLSKKIDSLPG